MVLDNADNAGVFFPKRELSQKEKESERASARLATYLPQNYNGSILITTRSKDAALRLTGSYKNIKQVEPMDENQALQLLNNKLVNTSYDESAADLLHALDYIPLAIAQATAYINRQARLTVSGYLEKFRKSTKKKVDLLKRDADDIRRDTSSSNSVISTWQISFEQIRKERHSAADLLSLMSFFNPQGIPESVLRSYTRSMARENQEDVENNNIDTDDADDEFDDDLSMLQAYSLVQVTAVGNLCEMY